MTSDEILDFCYVNDVVLKFDYCQGHINREEDPYHLKVSMKRAYRYYNDPARRPKRIFLPKVLENCPFSAIQTTLAEMVAEVNRAQQEAQLRVNPKNALTLDEPVYIVWEIPNDLIEQAANSRITNLEYLQQLNCNDFASVLFDLIWCQRGQDSSKCGSCRLNECECCLDYGSLVKWLKEEREVYNIE